MAKLATASQVLKFIPSDAEYLPAGLKDARRYIDTVSERAQGYLTLTSPISQMAILEELRKELSTMRDTMTLIKPPVGPTFLLLAGRWLDIVEKEAEECRHRIKFTPILNPFIVGNPLQSRDQDLFKGRSDIIRAIEENIIAPNQRPALLLYGRRRIGKSSTLLSFPSLLNQFVSIYVDCQDGKWRESAAAFCYHLIQAVFDQLERRDLLTTDLDKPRFERFEKYPFTQLNAALNQMEAIARKVRKPILLTFDEYEKLEEGIAAGNKITREILDQIRSIVEHRQHIVVLFSGSHRFEEMRTVNWSDYLINVKTLELSFLSADDARELVMQPVPGFNMDYAPGVVERILALTHCQPYLLQAVASELVNYLNGQKRLAATEADLDIAVEKVLVTVQAYFFYTWQEDCSEEEREILQSMATNAEKNTNPVEHSKAIQSLCQKEILERIDHRYQFTIDLFRRWILKNQAGIVPGM